jgi:hypothetical protein
LLLKLHDLPFFIISCCQQNVRALWKKFSLALALILAALPLGVFLGFWPKVFPRALGSSLKFLVKVWVQTKFLDPVELNLFFGIW